MATTVQERPDVGPMLRDWRRRRRLSQLDLALEAGVSARHVSFVETGRARPSADMVLQLAEQLEVPLREQNHLLLAAGYAPVYAEHPLQAPELGPVRAALDRVLAGHDPYPAAVVDRGWNMVAGNGGIALLTADVAPALLEPPVNVLRVGLHPDGMAPHIANLAQWRTHLLDRLDRQVAATADPALVALRRELVAYPAPAGGGPDPRPAGIAGASADPGASVAEAIAVPLRLRTARGELTFLSTVTTFGTAVDITVAELAIESFFPADEATAAALAAGR